MKIHCLVGVFFDIALQVEHCDYLAAPHYHLLQLLPASSVFLLILPAAAAVDVARATARSYNSSKQATSPGWRVAVQLYAR